MNNELVEQDLINVRGLLEKREDIYRDIVNVEKAVFAHRSLTCEETRLKIVGEVSRLDKMFHDLTCRLRAILDKGNLLRGYNIIQNDLFNQNEFEINQNSAVAALPTQPSPMQQSAESQTEAMTEAQRFQQEQIAINKKQKELLIKQANDPRIQILAEQYRQMNGTQHNQDAFFYEEPCNLPVEPTAQEAPQIEYSIFGDQTTQLDPSREFSDIPGRNYNPRAYKFIDYEEIAAKAKKTLSMLSFDEPRDPNVSDFMIEFRQIREQNARRDREREEARLASNHKRTNKKKKPRQPPQRPKTIYTAEQTSAYRKKLLKRISRICKDGDYLTERMLRDNYRRVFEKNINLAKGGFPSLRAVITQIRMDPSLKNGKNYEVDFGGPPVARKNICYNCQDQGHHARDCSKPPVCRYCDGPHRSSLDCKKNNCFLCKVCGERHFYFGNRCPKYLTIKRKSHL